MHKLLLLVIPVLLYSCSSKSQQQKEDLYGEKCLKFSEDLNSDVSITTIKTYFDTSVWSDSLELKLKDCRSALKKDRERIDYYITKLSNIENHKTTREYFINDKL